MKQQKILLCAIGVFQPPSGGCVLKLFWWNADVKKAYQPPSGGCVLKPFGKNIGTYADNQPPSGGCVLKRLLE